MKYVIQAQGAECVKQGINPICVKFPIFLKIIKSVVFPERSKYFSQLDLLSLKCLNTLVKPQRVSFVS